jgi:hypothetical protein
MVNSHVRSNLTPVGPRLRVSHIIYLGNRQWTWECPKCFEHINPLVAWLHECRPGCTNCGHFHVTAKCEGLKQGYGFGRYSCDCRKPEMYVHNFQI